MAKLTYAQQQRVARRTADITRLQSQYARSVEDYTASVGTKETAFKAEMEKYNAAYEPYQAKATAYQTRLSDYQKKLEAYQKAPLENYDNYQYIPRLNAYASRDQVKYGNQTYGPKVASGPFISEMVADPNASKGGIPTYAFRLKSGYSLYGNTISGKSVADPGTFNEKFDEQAPLAPAALDISAEKAKLENDKAYTEREVDERSKARLRAVQRGNTRPMLSAGTNISGGSNG